jgi:hypothetical protein
MIVAFTDLGNRADSVHASLVVANAVRTTGAPVTHLHVSALSRGTSGPSLGGVTSAPVPEAIRVARKARTDGCDVVLDLSSDVAFDRRWTASIDALVVVVGPYADDERAAAGLKAGTSEARRPIWYLGCRRSGGGPAAAAFAARMADLGCPDRLLPVTLPALSRAEAEDLARGVAGRRVLGCAADLLSALRRIAEEPGRERVPGPVGVTGSAGGHIAATADTRSFVERLRDLADDLDALGDGHGPPPASLAGAPVLEGWSPEVFPVRVLKGSALGHPGIPNGRTVLTTEVMATDDATWARTVSRYYVLRNRAGSAGPGRLQ